MQDLRCRVVRGEVSTYVKIYHSSMRSRKMLESLNALAQLIQNKYSTSSVAGCNSLSYEGVVSIV